MPTSLFDDQAAPPRDPDVPAFPPEPPHRRSPGGPRKIAVLVGVSALVGGGSTAGVLAAAGQLDGGSSRTTVVQSPVAATPAADRGTGAAIDARALYASASPGVVDITARGVSSSGTATGTGFVADDAGHIVTAAHVVDGASSVTVKFADGTTRRATPMGQDDATDVAVLKIDPSGLTLHPLKLG